MLNNATTPLSLTLACDTTDLRTILIASTASVLILIGFYIIVALIIYETRERRPVRYDQSFQNDAEQPGRRRRLPSAGFPNSTEEPYSRRRRLPSTGSLASPDRTTKNNVLLRTFCLISAVVITARCAHELYYIFIGSILSDHDCTVSLRVHIVLYALSVTSIYTFLWLRQRVLYNTMTNVIEISVAIRAVSWSIIIIMVISELGTIVIFMATRSYVSVGCQCTVKAIDQVFELMPWVVLAGCTVTFQCLLLWLFILPLHRHRMSRNSTHTGIRVQNRRSSMPLVKRVALATFICIISDIAAAIVSYFTNVRLSNLIYDVNLIVNLICIVCSFKNWRERLFSPFEKNSASQPASDARRPVSARQSNPVGRTMSMEFN